MRNLILVLVIIGAVNWGLIGFFGYDLVGSIFGGQLALISRIIFAVVGLAGIYAISFFFRPNSHTVES
ncbi:DUF378 domain-containing protein [Sinanaerobacter sp. ZZT-01]|uniref:DUF378 domain-containing protein n=1 Tax=Sinanaerobacter sp. ZZT-01 TaxID=3111540 RepID=UPI002D7897F0|nr:DUF378 domain-containing protein [Sinanaerobacter sp. ZZT-01]WRR94115.1 DUF378 domain-containing protein [Sinanaerobacter sp. ZZT-01]